MTTHKQRDSLTGFNRKRLRGTLRLQMDAKPNSAMFESRGQSWSTTASEERQEAQRKQLLERQLREASKKDKKPYKPSEIRNLNSPQHTVVKPLDGPPTKKQQREIEAFVRAQLADAGPLAPVKVDKQKLAAEDKNRKQRDGRSSRDVSKLKHVALARRVHKLARLHKELAANERVFAVTADKHQDFDHFVKEKD